MDRLTCSSSCFPPIKLFDYEPGVLFTNGNVFLLTTMKSMLTHGGKSDPGNGDDDLDGERRKAANEKQHLLQQKKRNDSNEQTRMESESKVGKAGKQKREEKRFFWQKNLLRLGVYLQELKKYWFLLFPGTRILVRIFFLLY